MFYFFLQLTINYVYPDRGKVSVGRFTCVDTIVCVDGILYEQSACSLSPLLRHQAHPATGRVKVNHLQKPALISYKCLPICYFTEKFGSLCLPQTRGNLCLRSF